MSNSDAYKSSKKKNPDTYIYGQDLHYTSSISYKLGSIISKASAFPYLVIMQKHLTDYQLITFKNT